MKKNYYEEVIETINNEKNIIKQKKIIEDELNVSWIPEKYKNEFEKVLLKINKEFSLEKENMLKTKPLLDISIEELEENLKGGNKRKILACLDYIKVINTEKYSKIFESIFNNPKINILIKNKIFAILIEKEDNMSFNFKYKNNYSLISVVDFNKNYVLPLINSISDFIETTYKKEIFKKEKAYIIFSCFFAENLIIINRFTFEFIKNLILQGVENEQ
ncbi:hypothetical protein [Mycoplasma sp. 613B]